MNDKVLISIIMPVYNRESLIARAIQSVLNQTYQYFELIILDDGSTDNTAQVVQTFCDDKRIRYIKQENSGRPSLARNSAIKESKGEWLTFLDSDDTWVNNKLAIQVDILHFAIEREIKLSIISGDFNRNINGNIEQGSFFKSFDILNQLQKHSIEQFTNGTIYKKKGFLDVLYSRGFLATPCNMVRSKYVKNLGGFNKELTFFEDNDLWLKLAAMGQVALTHNVLATYFLHGENITSDQPEGLLVDTIKGLNKHLQLEHISQKSKSNIKERIMYYELSLCLATGKKNHLKNYLSTSIFSLRNIKLLLKCILARLRCRN